MLPFGWSRSRRGGFDGALGGAGAAVRSTREEFLDVGRTSFRLDCMAQVAELAVGVHRFVGGETLRYRLELRRRNGRPCSFGEGTASGVGACGGAVGCVCVCVG